MTVEHSNTENTTALRIYYCGREQCAPGHFWGPAIRPHYLLHVVLHGKGEFFYQEKKYELSAGDAFLIEPMQTHYYQADKKDPWEYAWVGFDGSCVEEVLSSTIFQSSPVFTTDSALCIQPMIRLNALFFAPEKNPLGLASAFLRLLSCMTRLDTSVEMITMNSIISRHWNISAIVTL